MPIAIFAGSFDPITNGHLSIIRRGSQLFDELVVLVALNPGKKHLFTVEERVALINDAVKELPGKSGIVWVGTTEGYIVDYAREISATVLLRGIRTERDIPYEFDLARENRVLARDRGGQEITTVFLDAEQRHAELSSSVVRERARFPDLSLKQYCPPNVARALKQRYGLPEVLDQA